MWPKKKFEACLHLKHVGLFNNIVEVFSGHVRSVYGHDNIDWKAMLYSVIHLDGSAAEVQSSGRRSEDYARTDLSKCPFTM